MSTEPIEDPRIQLAAERTLLAWIRTGLSLMGFGFVVARFGLFLREIAGLGHFPITKSSGASLGFGVVLVGMGVVVNIAAACEHATLLRSLQIKNKTVFYYLGTIVAIALAILSIGIIAYFLLASY